MYCRFPRYAYGPVQQVMVSLGLFLKNRTYLIACLLLFLVVDSSVFISVAASSSKNVQKAALVFLHGLGDSPAGWSDLKRSLPQICPRLSNLVYSFPAAPMIDITIKGGATMPGWFDLYDWPIAIGSKDDKEGLLRSIQQIEDEIEKIETNEGVPRDRIVVGGFSQGGVVALLTAYYNNKNKSKEPLAGCAALSAWLTLCDGENGMSSFLKENVKKTPLFWGHGTYDDKVLFEQQMFGVTKLAEIDEDNNIQTADYPMGHSSHPKEIQDLAKFIDKILFGKSDESNEL